MEDVSSLKATREVIESELENTDSDSVRARFTGTFRQYGGQNENSVVSNEIELIYSPLRQRIGESLSEQEYLIENIRRANRQFEKEKKGNVTSEIHEVMLKNLDRAYDTFTGLLNNLEEGLKVCVFSFIQMMC
jgi:hypothetical protein